MEAERQYRELTLESAGMAVGTVEAVTAQPDIPAVSYEVPYTYTEKPVYDAVKRVCDVVLASLALIVLSPLMLIVAAAIVIDDPGDGPIFTQPRIAKGCKQFKMYKFRSMCVDAEEKLKTLTPEQKKEFEAQFKLDKDPRITSVGYFIRRTSLDELPQLINIIRGDMSIVGPRPPLLVEDKAYGPHLAKVMSVRPGLTGYWQVHGRSETDFAERIRMTEYYIDHRSPGMDIKIIWDTFGVVFSGKGAQ